MITTTSTAPLAPGSWALDTHHTSVAFAIRHLGVSKVRGRFDDVSAELTVGPTLEDCHVTATIALASVDTGNAERDEHLRASELLDVERRPTMSYRSSRIRGDGPKWAVDGELTIGDVTRPLTLDVELGGVEDGVGAAPWSLSVRDRYANNIGASLGASDADPDLFDLDDLALPAPLPADCASTDAYLAPPGSQPPRTNDVPQLAARDNSGTNGAAYAAKADLIDAMEAGYFEQFGSRARWQAPGRRSRRDLRRPAFDAASDASWNGAISQTWIRANICPWLLARR